MISETVVGYRISQCLRSCLATAKREGLDIIVSSLESIIATMERPMQLAIIGKVSSSKSTLVNAILGEADVVGTGQMEETFNVSWLKYGPSDSDILVRFKDGSSQHVPRVEWKAWSGQQANSLRNNVKYLEVTYEHEILKTINLIDTPGLDSAKGTDSKNTISFLSEVRPDAIIMVFTKGLAESTMNVVKEFQGANRNAFNLSPLNAIGLLSKTDYLWRINDGQLSPNFKAKRDVIEGNIYKLFPEIKNSIFTILPICAMLGLASSTVTESDILLLNSLARTEDRVLSEMLHSVNDFSDDFFLTDVSINERLHLQQKFGLYGVFEAICLSRKGVLSKDNLERHFKEISGFEDFQKCLYSHFGHRSFLIKTQSASAILSKACESQREYSLSPLKLKVIDDIQESILSCLMGIFEYKQLDFLSKIYDNQMNNIDKVAIEEYKRVCGEYGASVVDKLNLSGKPDIDELETISIKRSKDWNAKYHLSFHKSRESAELYHMLFSSYDMLAKDIRDIGEKEKEAKKIINLAEDFLYGK